MSDYIDLNGEAQSFGDTAAQREVRENDRNYVFHSWSAQGQINPLPIAKGEGVRFWDYDGNEYLDFSSQLVNLNLGHQHPGLVKAIQDQAGRLATIQPALANDVRGELAKRIVEHSFEGARSVFFTNGGAEAIEYAVRLARQSSGKRKILSRYRSYHGSTGTAITMTGEPRRWANDVIDGEVVHFFGPYAYRSAFFASTPEEESQRALAHLEQQSLPTFRAHCLLGRTVEQIDVDLAAVGIERDLKMSGLLPQRGQAATVRSGVGVPFFVGMVVRLRRAASE